MSVLSGRSIRQAAEPAGRKPAFAAAGDVLPPAHGTHESRPVAAEPDRLRTMIVTDESRHGEWLPLAQYGPLPKRIALALASSWRRAKPDLFGGDRHFLARIMPLASDHSSPLNRTVRSETLYAVEVSYPHAEHPHDPHEITPE